MSSVASSDLGPLTPAVVLEEDDQPPTEEEVHLYASSIGIDVNNEPHLLSIAREGISAPLPSGWQVLQDENSHIFYYNGSTGISLWEHPLDSQFRQKVNEARRLFSHNPTKQRTRGQNQVVEVKNTTQPQASQVTSNPESKTTNSQSLLSQTISTNRPCPSVRTPFKQASNNSSAEPSNGLHQIQNGYIDDHTTRIKSPSSIDEPTEYMALKLSSTQTQSPSLLSSSSHATQKVQIACQTDKPDFLDPKQWSETYSRALHQAEGRLSLLQSKLRESLSANRIESLPKVNTTNLSNSCAKSLQSSKSSQRSTISSRKSSRSCEDLVELGRFVTASPSYGMDKSGLNGSFLNCAPEVGTSPSEVKRPTQNDPDSGFVAQERQENPTESKPLIESSSSPALGHITEPNKIGENIVNPVAEQSTKVILFASDPKHQQSPTVRSLNNISDGVDSLPAGGVQVGFSEGIGHIIEERSRIQRKLLKLKLIYKTYKQRLASLDASLSILQQSTVSQTQPPVDRLLSNQTSSHYQTPTTSYRQIQQTPVTPSNYPVITPLPANASIFSLSPDSANKENNVSRIPRQPHSLSFLTKPAMNSPDFVLTSTSTASPYLGSGINPITNPFLFHKHRRSLSASRASIDALRRKCDLHSTSTYSPLLHNQNRSMSQELANSLASIDDQLHRVLNQLDLNDSVALSGPDNQILESGCPSHSKNSPGSQNIPVSCTRVEDSTIPDQSNQTECNCHSSRTHASVLAPVCTNSKSNQFTTRVLSPKQHSHQNHDISGHKSQNFMLLTPATPEDVVNLERPVVDLSPTHRYSRRTERLSYF